MYCVRNIEEIVLLPSKEYLERTVFPMFRTQNILDFFVAEHYGFWNTMVCGTLYSWGSKDLASR
jgi:hypothetical protein